MKRILLNFAPLLTIALCVAFSLSSCLGDSESSVEFQNDFVYIDSDKIASNASGGYPFISDVTNALQAGDCARISYKISSSNMSGGIFVAENVQRHKTFNKSKGSQIELEIGNVPPPSGYNIETYPSDPSSSATFGLKSGTDGSHTGNRWLFAFQAANETSDDPISFFAQFYYNPDPQAQKEPSSTNSGEMVDVPDNCIIIDVRFYEARESNLDGTTSDFACDLSRIKTSYTPDYSVPGATTYNDGSKSVPVYFKFRYKIIKDGEVVYRYLGRSWNDLYMQFHDQQ